MASASLVRIRKLCLLLILADVTDISEEVSVQHVLEPITARDSDRLVILPCDFYTKTYETPEITWYHETLDERRLIMRYDIHNRLSSYGEFEGRVVRGDRGALVLLGPRSRDAGNYSCEVEVDNEIPSRVKSTVMLKVIKDTVATNDDNAMNRTVLISMYWLISVMCALLLNTGLRTLARNAFYHPGNMPTKQRLKHILISLVTVFAMGLIFAGVICAVKSISKFKSTTLNSNYWTVSMITGIPGILILSLIAAWSCLPGETCCKKRCLGRSGIQETHEMSSNRSTAVCYIASSDTQDPMSTLLERKTNTAVLKSTAVLPQTKSIKELSQVDIKVFSTPCKETVTGMASLGDDVYVTTTSTFYQLNPTEKAGQKQFKRIFVRYARFLSLGKYKDGLLICASDKSTLDEENVIYQWSPRGKRTDKVFLPVKSTILWAQEGRGDELVYVALSNPNVISKRNLQKKTGEHIWNGVLKKPECIVQNSRGQFIVADSAKNDLFVFEEDGEFLSTMKVSVPKQFEEKLNKCNRIAIDEDNRIYVSSPGSSDVLVFNEDFRFERMFQEFSGSMDGISCLLVHSRSLYVAHGDSISSYSL
ncbi:uncharacterized protein LOC135481661 [Liolophura sinensis]|uniref:uncharacterized protein LOC135481661 n=1 Tax=Liolophura sinensis TaxID=3198878 RepID=UPI00315835A9